MISGREYAKIAENIKKSSFPERASQLPAAVLRFVALILGCGFIGLAAAGIAAKLPLLLVMAALCAIITLLFRCVRNLAVRRNQNGACRSDAKETYLS